MKILIENNGQMGEYKIYQEGKSFPLKNMRKNINVYDFSEDDIFNLIGEKDYSKFEKGKFEFNVTKSHLDLVTGQRSAKTKQELDLYND